MWGAIASAAIGALGARKTAKAMQGANDLDLAKLRREAEQNGFNPLTVLRATGGQGSTKGPSGNLASGAFFQTFAQGIPAILEANYNKKIKQAQLTNINASTTNLLAGAKSMLTKKDDDHWNDPIAFLRKVVDTDNKTMMYVVNPELLENSLNEALSSIALQGIQYTYQNGAPIEQFLGLIKGLPESHKKTVRNLMNAAKGEFPILNKENLNKAGNFLDKLLLKGEFAIGHTRNNGVLSTKTIRGLTNKARKTQDQINGFVRSDY